MLAGQPVQGFAYDKVRALLAYLAVEQRYPHARETLGSLLWPEADSNTARSNLRKALFTLRKAICEDDSSPYLIIHPDTVQFNPESDFWLDVDQLQKRLDAPLKHAHPQLESCDSCMQDLEEAAALYRGSFLQGMLIDSLEFEEWLLTIREHLHTRILSAFHSLSEYYLCRGEYGLAQKYALRQVELEPYREEAHRALMQSLACSGQRSAALGQYERCRKILKEALGVEPGAKTQQLYHQIRSAGELRPHNLPARQESLVGRRTELHQLGRQLANPDCRLVTLVGMGGIGKTSLALETAWENLGNFWHGAYLVSLGTLRQPAQVLAATLSALRLALSSDPETQLLDYLREKSILLVLDNFEHLLPSQRSQGNAAVALVNSILQGAPNVKILITSRERLNLRAEWVFPVEGLSHPPEGAEETAETLAQYAAIQLFLRHTRQVLPAFPAQAEEFSQIARICKLVSGIPLAIELASGWVDQLTCQAIADGIELDLEFLRSTLRDMPDRHQSLRAVFDHSWKLLTDMEQVVLSSFAVLRAAFSRAAAREVCQATPHQLTALINKSLLRPVAGGRFEMHSLLKQYLVARLAATPSEEKNARRAHADFFIRFLEERQHALIVQSSTSALQEVEEVIADLEAAWDWAVEQRNISALQRAFDGLSTYYWARNQFAEGQATLEKARESIQACEPSPPNQLLFACLQCRIAEMLFWQGDLQAAEQLVKANTLALQVLDATDELAYAWELLSRIALWQGDIGKSKENAATALDFARLSGAEHLLAQALSTLGSALCDDSSDYRTIESLYSESLAIYQRIENPFGIAKVLLNQGTIWYEQREYTQAQKLYQESLNHYRAVDYAYGISACLNNLAILARKMGDYRRAKTLIEESLTLKRETGNRVAILHSLLEIAAIDTVMQNYPKARSHLSEALQIATKIQAVGLIFHIVLGCAELYSKTDQLLQAATWTRWIMAQKEVGQEIIDKAEALYTEFEPLLTEAEQQQCKRRASAISNEALITVLTNELCARS